MSRQSRLRKEERRQILAKGYYLAAETLAAEARSDDTPENVKFSLALAVEYLERTAPQHLLRQNP